MGVKTCDRYDRLTKQPVWRLSWTNIVELIVQNLASRNPFGKWNNMQDSMAIQWFTFGPTHVRSLGPQTYLGGWFAWIGANLQTSSLFRPNIAHWRLQRYAYNHQRVSHMSIVKQNCARGIRFRRFRNQQLLPFPRGWWGAHSTR